MKLIRLAVIQLASAAEDWHGSSYDIDGVRVQVLRAQQRDHDHFLLIGAIVPMQRDPEINTDGYIFVPEPERAQGEVAIEAFANLLAVSTRSSRRIFSPIPYVAFIPEDREVHDRFNRTKGIFLPTRGRGMTFSPFHVSDDACLRHLSDRSDGVAHSPKLSRKTMRPGAFVSCIAFSNAPSHVLKHVSANYSKSSSRETTPFFSGRDQSLDQAERSDYACGPERRVPLRARFPPRQPADGGSSLRHPVQQRGMALPLSD